MKFLFVVLVMIGFAHGAQIDDFATEVRYERSYEKASKMARAQKKILMLVVVADYCPWCKKLERKTLTDAAVIGRVGDNCVAVIIDKYKDKGAYPQELEMPIIPVVLFINPKDGKILTKATGYMKPDEFLKNMDNALALFKVTSK